MATRTLQFCIFGNGKQWFWTRIFRGRWRSFHDEKWSVLRLCGRCEHIMTNVQLFLSSYFWSAGSNLIFTIARTQFASEMTLNNEEMIAGTRSYCNELRIEYCNCNWFNWVLCLFTVTLTYVESFLAVDECSFPRKHRSYIYVNWFKMSINEIKGPLYKQNIT